MTAAGPVLNELRGLIEVPRLVLRAPSLHRAARGSGAPVLVLPGRSVDDLSTLPLRCYLRTLGHAPTGWGMGVNDGDLGRLVPAVGELAEELAVGAGAPIALVGQSMGGAIARAVARTRPASVRQVITIGSPIMSARSREPLHCPLTVIYSEADQVVPPHWALAHGDGAEVVEVSSAHFSMGLDPDVWEVVAERLGSAVPDQLSTPTATIRPVGS